MAIFRAPNLGYPVYPGADPDKQVIAGEAASRSADFGPIHYPNWDTIQEFLGWGKYRGKPKKPPEARPPPELVAGGPYPAAPYGYAIGSGASKSYVSGVLRNITKDSECNSAYDKAVNLARSNGFPVYEMPLMSEKLGYGEHHGWEDPGTKILYVAREIPKERKARVVLHEYASKILREQFGPSFDHNRNHGLISELENALYQMITNPKSVN